jgi:mannose/cellobiose epimerase-like protein (N-acyl-D-glucosamine 2-epimerase family)
MTGYRIQPSRPKSRLRPLGRVKCQGRRAPGCRSTSHRYLNGHTGAVLGRAIRAVAEEFTPEWQPLDCYRGQNSKMHLTESLMAVFEATSDSTYPQMAERIANLIIGGHAAANGWRVPEHFTNKWVVDRTYAGSPMLRSYGTTPEHSLEWSRLLLQLWELGGRKLDWLPQSSKALFARVVLEG